MRFGSGCGCGVVADLYIHQRARCLGSSERVSAIAKRRMLAGGVPGPSTRARLFSSSVIWSMRPRAWFASISTLGNHRPISWSSARDLVVSCQLVDHPLPCRVVVHGVGGGVEMAGEGFLGVEWEVGSVEPEAS